MARTIDSSDDPSSELAAAAQAAADDSALVDLPPTAALPLDSKKEVLRAFQASFRQLAETYRNEQGLEHASESKDKLDQLGAKALDEFEAKLVTLSKRFKQISSSYSDADQAMHADFDAEIANFKKCKADYVSALQEQETFRDSLKPRYAELLKARNDVLNESIEAHGELLSKETNAVKSAYKMKDFSPEELVKLMQQFSVVEQSEEESDG